MVTELEDNIRQHEIELNKLEQTEIPTLRDKTLPELRSAVNLTQNNRGESVSVFFLNISNVYYRLNSTNMKFRNKNNL